MYDTVKVRYSFSNEEKLDLISMFIQKLVYSDFHAFRLFEWFLLGEQKRRKRNHL